MRFPVVGPSYKSRALAFSAQRSVNLYPEPAEADARGQWILWATPGIVSYADIGTWLPCRGAITMANIMYVVFGTSLYSVISGVATELGTIGGSDRLSIATNGSQIVFVSLSSGGWIYDVANGLRQITDADYQPANNVTFLNQYFVFSRQNSQQFFLSSLADGSSYDILDFASAEGSPDNLISVLADNGELWLFGQSTTEVWTNTGDPIFPFQRINGAVLSKGIAGIHACTRLDNTVYWLSNEGIVYSAQGYAPARISTFAIESQFDGEDLSGAFMFGYVQDGHAFLVLTVGGATYVYDAATQQWHERSSRDQYHLDGEWRCNHVLEYNGTLYAMDSQDSLIGTLDPVEPEEFGREIVCTRVTSMIAEDAKALIVDSVQLIAETGIGPSDGSVPYVSLAVSRDNGHTFGNEKFASAGAIGQYSTRIIWRRLGRAYQTVMRIQAEKRALTAWIDSSVEVSLA